MSRAPRRGGAPRKPTRRGGSTRKAAKRQSSLDRMIQRLPVSEATLHRIATYSILTFVGAAAVGTALFFGVPQAVGVAAAEEIGRAGLRVEGIEVTGTKHMNAMTVYAVALDQQSRAMPLVDVEGVRQKLLKYGWVADAQVSRRLPDKLVINIVERQPAAVWQNHGQLMLVDADGVLLEPVAASAMPDLPLIIGDGANAEAPAYRALLEAAPALKPLVRAATWVGNRRWNLLFTTGETLALPEDDPQGALVKFAEIDGARSLLGKGWQRFDMRDPTRLVARKPGGVQAHPLDAGVAGQPIENAGDTTGSIAPGGREA